jgi:hypothetical protein
MGTVAEDKHRSAFLELIDLTFNNASIKRRRIRESVWDNFNKIGQFEPGFIK